MKGKSLAIVAVMFFACTARAVDWPEPGDTYTVPANTTNVVSDADIAAFNALGKVVFTDATSALLFTTDTAPNVPLEGAGWMIKDSPGEWTVTQQQTTAWVGTWDIQSGSLKLSSPTPSTSAYDALFAAGCADLHDVYVRKGAKLRSVDKWTCQAYKKVRFYLGGQVESSAGGFSPTYREIHVTDDGASIYSNASTLPTLASSGAPNYYESGLRLDGHSMVITGGNNSANSFWVQGSSFIGPGALTIDKTVCSGLSVRSYSHESWDGCLVLDGGLAMTGQVRLVVYDPKPDSDFKDGVCKYGLICHRNASLTMSARGQFGKWGGRPAYLLEGGSLSCPYGLSINSGNPADPSTAFPETGRPAAYLHFRQIAGDFSVTDLSVTNFGLRADFVFGGTGSANLAGDIRVAGDAAMVFKDDIDFSVRSNSGGYLKAGTGHHIWAYNGGMAEYRILDAEGGDPISPEGDFFAFNGGVRAVANESSTSADVLQTFGTNPCVRVYAKGGGIRLLRNEYKFDTKLGTGEIREPRGNVVKSITCPSSLLSQQFLSPPSVDIVDAAGTGSNAVAVVDYDFDTRTVTNITVLCGGENYSSSENVKANLRFYSGDGKKLLKTDLDCTVGPETGGDFTFSATNKHALVRVYTSTNDFHGSLIVDMDQLGIADGGKIQRDWGNALNIYYGGSGTTDFPCFPNCTNIILKSGQLSVSSCWGYDHTKLFLNCYSIEFYGGHIAGGTFLATNVVVGGTAYLTGHNLGRSESGSSPYWVDLQLCDGLKKSEQGWRTKTIPPTPGTMVVDVDSTPDDVPAALKGGGKYIKNDVQMYHGMVRFGGTAENPSRMTIRNYGSLQNLLPSQRRVLLDLSDENLEVIGAGNVQIVRPPDLDEDIVLVWNADQKKLYARRNAVGLTVIFR